MSKKQDPAIDFGFHAVIPRILRTDYTSGDSKLSAAQKWLYVCLKDLCGDHGTCYRTLRTLADETDFSIGMLSESIPALHNAKLIHAEKKRRQSGGKEVWHITIVDIWQKNAKAHPTKRSAGEQECSAGEQTGENVQDVNENVHNVNEKGRECSPTEQECSVGEPAQSCERAPHAASGAQNEVVSNNNRSNNNIEAITMKDSSSATIVATPPPVVVEDGPKEQETPTRPKRTRTRKPAVEMTEEERTRVNGLFDSLDKLRQKVTGDAEERYSRDRDAVEAVLGLLRMRKPTQERLQRVFEDMWQAPRDPKTGFYWREHMTVPAICKQYERKSMSLVASEKKQQLDTTRTQPGSGYRIVSTDEAEQAGGMRVLTRQERDAQRNRGRTAVL